MHLHLLAILQAIAILYAVVFTATNERQALVEISLLSETPDTLSIYWSSGDGFNAQQRDLLITSAGMNRSAVLGRGTLVRPTEIRIDPLLRPVKFSIKQAQMQYQDCLVPLKWICVLDLEPENAVFSQQVERLAPDAEYRFASTGVDPFFIWNVPVVMQSRLPAYVLNIGLLGILFGAIWALIRYTRRTSGAPGRRGVLLTLWSLALYPVFALYSWLAGNYLQVSGVVYLFLYINLLVFIFLIIVGFWFPKVAKMVPGMTGIAVVMGIIMPDIMFHFGLIQQWPFGPKEPREYHWQLNRGFQDNLLHSSLKYSDEIKELGRKLPPGAVFLSDSATSYYIVAQLNAFTRNPMYHHRIGDLFFEKESLRKFCSLVEEEGGRVELLALLQSKGVKYVILNRDSKNRNVVFSCISGNYKRVRENIKTFTKQIYAGRYLLVFEVE